MSKKKLYINHDPEAHHDYMLGIVLRENTRNWFYENFVNLCALYGETLLIEFTDICESIYQKFLLSTGVYSIDEILSEEALKFYLIDKINKDSYSGIWVDEYHIPGTARYQKEHFVHTILIYGYDDECEIFNALHFNPEHGVIDLNIAYCAMFCAFFDIKNHYRNGGGAITLTESIISCKYSPRAIHSKYDIHSFMFALREYVFAQNKNDGLISGIGIYNRFINDLEENNNIVYRSLHTLTLHKSFIFSRLNHIAKLFDVSSLFLEYIDKYKDIVKKMERIRLANIKQNAIDKLGFVATLSTNQTYREKLSKTLAEVRDMEQDLLLKVYSEIKNISHHKSAVLGELICEDKYSVNKTNENITVTLDKAQYCSCIDIINIDDFFTYSHPGKIIFDDNSEILVEDSYIKGRSIILKNKFFKNFKFITNSMENIKFNIYSLPKQLEWVFEKPCLDWHAVVDIADVKYDEEAMICEVIGKDPYIVANSISFDARVAKYIYVQIKTEYDSCAIQLLFATEDNKDLTEEKSSVIAVSPCDDYQTYIFDMSDNLEWKGVITSLRLDIAHYDIKEPIGKCYIKKITVTDKLPIYNSKEQFSKTQGVLGWSYMSYNAGTTYKELLWDDNNKHWCALIGNENSGGINMKYLGIDATTQTSCCNYASARIWTCPASGKYKIDVLYIKKTYGQKSRFQIRLNHRILNSTMESEYSLSTELQMCCLERLCFEFYNADQTTVEYANITVVISKIESEDNISIV